MPPSPQTRLLRACAALAVAAAAACNGDAPKKAGPDVLVIVIDTLRADHCSLNGYARPTTPRLEELAKTSVTFTDAWAPAPHTCPSHATLFTGLRPPNHGLTESPDGTNFLGEAQVTLAEILQGAGWRTAGWSSNSGVSADFGLAQGFETFHEAWRTPTPFPWARGTHAEALAWMKERAAAKEPCFAFVNDMEPHAPYRPTAQSQARFVDPAVPASEIAMGRDYQHPLSFGWMVGRHDIPPQRWRLYSDLYDAAICDVDAAVGELMDGLRAAGRLDETLIVICGDHGESFGENGIAEHNAGVYRTLLHVPLLVRLPGKFDGGRRVTATVRLEDVLPTILQECGIAAPKGLDGVALTPSVPPGRIALAGFGPNPRAPTPLAQAFPGADMTLYTSRWHSVYDGRHHLVTRTDGTTRKTELFDVVADPGETKDLSATQADVRAKLEGRIPK